MTTSQSGASSWQGVLPAPSFQRAGDFIFVSSIFPLDQDGNVVRAQSVSPYVGESDIGAQTRACLDKLRDSAGRSGHLTGPRRQSRGLPHRSRGLLRVQAGLAGVFPQQPASTHDCGCRSRPAHHPRVASQHAGGGALRHFILQAPEPSMPPTPPTPWLPNMLPKPSRPDPSCFFPAFRPQTTRLAWR